MFFFMLYCFVMLCFLFQFFIFRFSVVFHFVISYSMNLARGSLDSVVATLCSGLEQTVEQTSVRVVAPHVGGRKQQRRRNLRRCCPMLKKFAARGIRLSKGSVKTKCFTAKQLIRMGHSKINSLHSRALAFQCTRQVAVHSLKSTAYLELVVQAAMLLEIMDRLRSDPPSWNISAGLFDEACQQSSLKLGGPAISATWHMVVYIVEITWGWDDGRSENIFLVIPPMPLTGTSASKVWDGLHAHWLTRPIAEFLDFLEKVTTDAPVSMQCSDDASANRENYKLGVCSLAWQGCGLTG